MKLRLAHITLVVRDYDEAIDWYGRVLGFRLIEDIYQPQQDKRWVTMAPAGDPGGPSFVLGRAGNDDQRAAIGNQTGGRVFLFVETDDLARDLARLRAENVQIIREPVTAPYGTVAVFADLYGNLWDLIERPDQAD